MFSMIQEFWRKQPEESDEYCQDLYRGKNLAKNYAAYRPTYPPALYDRIMEYHGQNNGLQLAVDVCCGTGQSTVPLTKFFDQVIAVDVSEDQVNEMPKDIANLTSYVCPAEELTMIESGTVDLLTTATGLHWVDFLAFFKEAKRVLKPGGTFAAYTWIPEQMENEEADKCYRELWNCHFIDYFTAKAVHVLDGYQSIQFPFEDLQRSEFKTKEEITIDHFKGFLHSMHCTKLYYEANPGKDVVGETAKRIENILRKDTIDNKEEGKIKLNRKYALTLGRNL